MMHRMIAVAVLAGFATQATALSCMRIDPPDAFTKAAEAPEPYIVVHGRFAFDTGALPQSHGEDARDTAIPARFTGAGLTRDGFTTPLDMPLTMDVQCLGPWCGAMPADTPALAFLERRDDGYHLTVSPCPGSVFTKPDTATLDSMTACINGGC